MNPGIGFFTKLNHSLRPTLALAGLLASLNVARTADPGFWFWAKTPPMGWNSWDSFGAGVWETNVIANADYMAKHLKSHGWEVVTIDIQWYEPLAHTTAYRKGAILEMDDEVIAVNQASLHNRQVFNRANHIAWVADVPNSKDKYVALFNASPAPVGGWRRGGPPGDQPAPAPAQAANNIPEAGQPASSLSDLGVFHPKSGVLDHRNTLAKNRNRLYVICERRVF
jgi:hypothetical protein